MLRIRGATTRRSERKRFLVTLFETQRFTYIKLRKFLLLNMLFDPHRFEMYTSYRLLAELGLFPSYFQYTSVFINGKPQGLYLLVERPEDAIRRSSSNAVSVIRPNGRRARVKQSVKYSVPQSDPLRLLHSIRLATRKKSGKTLEDELDRKMNLDRYLRWLAFNSLSKMLSGDGSIWWLGTTMRSKRARLARQKLFGILSSTGARCILISSFVGTGSSIFDTRVCFVLSWKSFGRKRS